MGISSTYEIVPCSSQDSDAMLILVRAVVFKQEQGRSLVVKHSQHLKDHLVRPLVASQTEASAEVRLQLGCPLDVRHERLVHLLLVFYPLGVRLLLCGCLAVLEELIFALAFLLLAGPVLILADARNDLFVQACNVDDRRSGNDVAVVDAAEWYTVGLEGAGDEEDALFELAQQYDALATEATGEEDKDGAGCERLAIFGGVCGLASLRHGTVSSFAPNYDYADHIYLRASYIDA